MGIATWLTNLWSATEFGDATLSQYAEEQMRPDTRIGLQSMTAFALAVQLCVGLIATAQGLPSGYVYVALLFGLLSLHIMISAQFVNDVRSLQTLGIAFLVIGAMCVTLLAHRSGDLTMGMMAAIVILIVSIPLVPWALREAAIVIGLTYLLLTASLAVIPDRFDAESFWVLQLLVLGAAAVVVIVTARNTHTRKNDIRARFELERAHREVEHASMRDHLTDTWNRRFLAQRFPSIASECAVSGMPMQVAVIDIDHFKKINDRHGHDVGDSILVGVAETLTRNVGKNGYVIRMGGDEFLILYFGSGLDDMIDRAVAGLRVDKLPGESEGSPRISLSAGIVRAERIHAGSLEQLYKAADQALYRAKENRPANATGGANVLVRTGTWPL